MIKPIFVYDRTLQRSYLFGRRLHHGLAGVIGIPIGITIIILSVAMIYDDWDDRPWLPYKELL
jgi:hypothetical protein